MPRFIVVQFGGMAQGEPDIVEPFEEAELAEGIDFEFCREALSVGDSLIGQGHGELVSGNRLRLAYQFTDLFFAERDQQDSVGEGGENSRPAVAIRFPCVGRTLRPAP